MKTPVLESLKRDSMNIVKSFRTAILKNICQQIFPFYEDRFTERTWIM